MASLKGSRTQTILIAAFSDAGRFDRLSRSSTAQGERAIEDNGGHLDFLVAGYDTSPPLESTAAELATAIAAMTDDHTAMFAGVACTAHDEGTADWFETVAITGRPYAGEMRRALDNNDECMRNR